jgi:molybdopterin converting factor small subunit
MAKVLGTPPAPFDNLTMNTAEAAAPLFGIRVRFYYWEPNTRGGSHPRVVEVPHGTTLEDLLAHLSLMEGRELRAQIAPHGSRFVTINGEHCPVPQDLGRILKDGDEVSLLPFVAGG